MFAEDFFEPIKYDRTNTTKVKQILEQVKEWNYLPSVKCIVETFNTSSVTANKVYEELLKGECRLNGIKNIRLHYRFKVMHEQRSSFKRIHLFMTIPKLIGRSRIFRQGKVA